MGQMIRTILLSSCLLVLSVEAAAQKRESTNQEARAIFQQLVEINTTESVGSVTKASEAMAKRLREAGFPEKDIIVAGPDERKKNLVVRLRGTGKRPSILF